MYVNPYTRPPTPDVYPSFSCCLLRSLGSQNLESLGGIGRSGGYLKFSFLISFSDGVQNMIFHLAPDQTAASELYYLHKISCFGQGSNEGWVLC